MPYNPNIHHRRSIRLKGYDYSQAGLYFITICCNNRICRFGKIVGAVGAGLAPAPSAQMVLNEYGNIAHNEWIKLAERFPNFELDVFQIMPNHMHGIIAIVGAGLALDNVRATLAVAPDDAIDDVNIGAGASPAPTTTSVGNMVGAYKSLVANRCLQIHKSKNETMGTLWQRNYYEHIIRNEQSYYIISNYIINNPAKWNNDKFYNQ